MIEGKVKEILRGQITDCWLVILHMPEFHKGKMYQKTVAGWYHGLWYDQDDNFCGVAITDGKGEVSTIRYKGIISITKRDTGRTTITLPDGGKVQIFVD